MPWLRVGDDAASHPITNRVRGFGPVSLTELDAWARAMTVFGFVTLCASQSAGHMTDFFVSKGTAQLIAGPDWERWAKDATRAGYWSRAKKDGEAGYLIVDIEEFIHIRQRAAVEFDRMRDKDRRNNSLTMPVRRRDGDACRYCGLAVNWHDRKGIRGGTYDHTDPAHVTTVDTYVVACRACNAGREQNPASYTLLPPPAEPYYHPKTLELLTEHGLFPLRPGSRPDTAQPVRLGIQPDTAQPPCDSASSRTPRPSAANPGPAARGAGAINPTDQAVSQKPLDTEAGITGGAGSGRVSGSGSGQSSGSGAGALSRSSARRARRRRARGSDG